MNTHVHRPLIAALLLVGIFMAPLSAATARQASPEAEGALLDALGLPVMEVVATADGMQLPADIATGPTLLTLSNQLDADASVDLVQLPDGVTVDDYLAVTQSEDGGVPEWAADLALDGTVLALPGATASMVINLAPGAWTVVLTSGAEVAQTSSLLNVTGDTRDEGTIVADLDVEFGEYAFSFPDTVASGPQVWHVTNVHNVLHHAVIFPVDQSYTVDEVIAGVGAEFSGTPVTEGFSMERAVVGPPFGLPLLSSGQEVWVEANLAPGFYVAVCFIADPGSTEPHLMRGMVDTFEVTGS